MSFANWFKRTTTHDCLVIDEVPDGMPVLDGEIKPLTLEGDMFMDSHLGLAYPRDRELRPIRVKDEHGKIRDLYFIVKRAGVACGIVLVKEPIERTLMIGGKQVNLLVDDLVLKLYTDPIMNYHIQDNKTLKTLLVQGLLGFEILMILMVGLLIGTFILGPLLSWLVASGVHFVMNWGH